MTPVEFRGDLWHWKTRVPGVSCGVVFVILRFSVLVEHRLVSDRQTQTQTDRRTQAHGYYRGCIALRGKNAEFDRSKKPNVRNQLSQFSRFDTVTLARLCDEQTDERTGTGPYECAENYNK